MKTKEEIEKGKKYKEKGQDLLQMYQAGFYDCWRKLKVGRFILKQYNLACLRSFEKRFIKVIDKKVKDK
jgi:hypothetical protein